MPFLSHHLTFFFFFPHSEKKKTRINKKRKNKNPNSVQVVGSRLASTAGCKWEGKQFIIFNPSSYFGWKSCLRNNEILISGPDRGRHDWQDYIWTKPVVNHSSPHEGTRPGICSPSVIKQNYIHWHIVKVGLRCCRATSRATRSCAEETEHMKREQIQCSTE